VRIHIHNLTFDCADPQTLARFWSQLTGWNIYTDDDPEVIVAPSFPYDGMGLLFVPVPEGKTAKNRVHIDLQPEGMTRDEAVMQAQALGGRVVGDHRNNDGSGWIAMADPEGNEFCIERSQIERGPKQPGTFKIS
jgi:predicted enzyme related to lactoylglutathione lyase